MPEQLAFDEVFRERAAVDRHERGLGPMTQIMNAAGDQLLARAGFAEDQDGGVGGGNPLDQLLDPLHRLAFAHDVRAAFDRGETLFQRNGLVEQGPLIGHFLQDAGHHRKLGRLGEEVEGAAAQRLDRFLHAAVTGADDHFGFGRDFFDVRDDIPPGEAGHAEVDNGRVERVLLHGGEGGFAVFADGDIVSEPGQLQPHDIADGGLVVDEQNTELIRGGGQFGSPRAVARLPACDPSQAGPSTGRGL